MLKQDQKFVTPTGVAQYPHLVEPDNFEGSLDYKVNLILDPADVGVQELIDSITASCEAEFKRGTDEMKAKGGKHIAAAKLMELFVPIVPEYNDVGEETGRVIFKAKSKAAGITKAGKAWERKIPLFDAATKKIPHGSVKVWSGSILKVEMQMNLYTAAGLKKSGCSLRIASVQVLELSEGGGGGGAFGVEEGGFDSSGLEEAAADKSPPSLSPDYDADFDDDIPF